MKTILLILMTLTISSFSGEYRTYYDTGELFDVTQTKNGQIHGIRKVYRKDGSLNWTSQFVNGKYDGDDIEYNRDGTLYAKVTFVNDVAVLIQCKNKTVQFHGDWGDAFLYRMKLCK